MSPANRAKSNSYVRAAISKVKKNCGARPPSCE